MKPALVRRTNTRKLVILAVLVLLASVAYLTVDVNPKYLSFAMGLRVPMLLVMLIAAFAIGGASIVFQSIIHNTIVTPCLLGMNSLYTLIHTVVVFLAGSGSILATNANAAFAVDLGIMGVTATVIYSYLFQKTKYNVLYVLLIGTVLTSFFGSIQSTLTRVMDPNEYDSLLSTLVASFSNVNGEIIVFALVVLAAILFFLRRDLACWMCSPWARSRPSTWGWIMTGASAGCCWGSPWPSLWPRRWWGLSPSWGSSWPTSPGSC